MKSTKKERILGLDIGGVLWMPVPDGTYGSLDRSGYTFLTSQPVEGALQAVDRLVRTGRFDTIHIVSKIKEEHEWKLRHWLGCKGFSELISPERVHFCRERRDKGTICKRLRVTHFVDDRLSVLQHLENVPNLFLLRTREHEDEKALWPLVKKRGIIVASSWREMLPKILAL